MNSSLRKLVLTAIVAVTGAADAVAADPEEEMRMGKPVVYQVFTRLFGNEVETNKPWGTNQ